MSDTVNVEALGRELESLGLLIRGGFHPNKEHAVPPLPDGRAVSTVLIVGNAGPAMWQVFSTDQSLAPGPNRMNRWTEKVIGEFGERWQAAVWFPFQGPPYFPFQRWAQQAEQVWSSPLGILMHPEYGLWHAYRAALGFAQCLPLEQAAEQTSPCLRCEAQPCLTTCPVEAFDGARYAVDRCRAHIDTAEGSDCLQQGCRARRACPIGAEFQYVPEQAGFHMQAFLSPVE